MLARLYARLKASETTTAAQFARDPSDPALRRAAWWHYQLMDHAFLRALWTNFAQIAPGVYRSNHPSPARLARYRNRGIRAIITLRGGLTKAAGTFEREACRALGLTLHEVYGFSAVRLPGVTQIDALEATFRATEKPFVIHCKSGSDRTGLAAALYLLLIEGAPVEQAARQLSWRFIHFPWTRTGVLDAMLATYGADHAQTGIGFRAWLDTRYDPEAITRAFDAGRARSGQANAAQDDDE